MVITLLLAELMLDSPWALAAPEAATGKVDQPLASDAHGQPYVPASSLAGSLRAHLGPQTALQVLGGPDDNDGRDQPTPNGPTSDQDEQRLRPSALRLLGTRLLDADSQLVRSTAIDPTRGAARPKTLRTIQTGQTGTRIRLFARYDDQLPDGLLATLAAWQPAIGGRRSSGLGRAHLPELRWGQLDLTNPTNLATWLLEGGEHLVDTVATHPVPLPHQPTAPWLAVGWRIVDGLLIADQADGPTTRIWQRTGQPYIEGTSLKGVLRHRVGFILASRGDPTCHQQPRPCGACTTCELFGSTEQRGKLAVRGTPIHQAHIQRWPHVAIDRITGASSTHRLFDEQVVVAGRFDLVIDALTPDLPATARWLLLQACADLHDGLCGIGGRTSRGLGTIELEDPSVLTQLQDLHPAPTTAEVAP